jgi:ribosomal protein S18 acetylase RimI-like enzyme
MYRIVEITPEHRKEVNDLIKEAWAGPIVVSRGRAWDTSVLPGFIALEGDRLCGAITYRMEGNECEITTLNSLREGKGIGTGLINAVIDAARKNRCRRVWLITTNDNMHAIRFYQRFGFVLRAVHINAIEKSRELKPSMPPVGIDDIPILHEFEFEIIL